MRIKGKVLLIAGILFMVFFIYLRVSATNQTLNLTDEYPEQSSNDSDPNYSDLFTFMDDFMKDPNLANCYKCHVPTIKGHWEVTGITASCARGNNGINDIGCHSFESNSENPRALGRTHPVVDTRSFEDLWEVPDNMRKNMPPDFHLEEEKYITCVTCHDPRRDALSDIPMVGGDDPVSYDPEKYRSYFLRCENKHSKLCWVCHRDKF